MTYQTAAYPGPAHFEVTGMAVLHPSWILSLMGTAEKEENVSHNFPSPVASLKNEQACTDSKLYITRTLDPTHYA